MGYDTEVCKAHRCYNTATFESGYCAEHDPESIQENRIAKLEKRMDRLYEYLKINRIILIEEKE
jgi:hypothetical protein